MILSILARNPKIIGFGVYIWNVEPVTEVIAMVKRLRPAVVIVLGGPEVSYEVEDQAVAQLADHVITGEADLKFAELCRGLLEEGSGQRPPGRWAKVIPAELPDFTRLNLPYDLYTDEDIAHRILYVEASRGCPFSCEFCLSSLDIPVREVPLPPLLEHFQRLLNRGARQLKFVDRTFNLNVNVSRTILEFFLSRYQPGHFFHFEMVPDRLPEALRSVIAKFPPGALQFEIGIQTFNPEVGSRIKRRQDYQRLEENVRFLRRQTGAHIHADLIAGLPGETLNSFAAGFDRLVCLGPHEIQVGILKRLRGTPISRHDAEWQMVYSPQPPYEILQNRLLDFPTLQRMRRFARIWDLVGNSGNFIESTPLIWSLPPTGAGSAAPNPGEGKSTPAPHTVRVEEPPTRPSPFYAFLRWTDWLHARVGRTDSIALLRLMEFLFQFLAAELKLDPGNAARSLWRDYQRGGRYDKPAFLKEHLGAQEPPSPGRNPSGLPRRQARHLA
jgi:hypothetical protein